MVVTCILVLELGKKVLVSEPVTGTVLEQSDLRYIVDFSFDARRITYRDLTLNWARFAVKRDQCVTLR